MRRHPIDLFALLSGLVVLGFSVAYLLSAYTDIRFDGRLAVPLLLVGLGAVGVVGALVAQRRADRRLDHPGPTQ